MAGSKPQYISASRRTDIPRFFLNEFFDAWEKGTVTYDGGYGRTHTVSLKPQDVLGYVFWSKDFSLFINHPLLGALLEKNNAVFHYTINDCPELEPRVTALAYRIQTLCRLCDIAGAERVFWRFDPICKFKRRDGTIATNVGSFFNILPLVRKAGITRCFFSFMSHYSKLKKRDVLFSDFDRQERATVGRKLLEAATQAGMKLYNCCNPEVVDLVPGILPAHCIDDDLLRATDRFGVHPRLSLKPTRPGCGCYESRDIGSYVQKCPHRCAYCYANPA
jgi:hypothetical protein